jgi:Zn-dependent protease
MPATRSGSIHLFQIAGIDVFLHWSWFIIAIIEVGYLRNRYTSLVWSVLEYLALFLIVLLHEFGHALACRQVGGTADRIVLWPLGGVAVVNPPQRPGAMLWSIAAGPLVNVALLVPLGAFGGKYLVDVSLRRSIPQSDAVIWLTTVLMIDIGLLLFNILPIYPLDGGQILRSVLWFVLGRGRSLLVATAIGFVGVAGFLGWGLLRLSPWTLAISIYMLFYCWRGWKAARVLTQMEKMPRREGFACPSCGAKPPMGPLWRCAKCGNTFDTFATEAECPWCNAQFGTTTCIDCNQTRPIRDWMAAGSHPGVVVASAGTVVNEPTSRT